MAPPDTSSGPQGGISRPAAAADGGVPRSPAPDTRPPLQSRPNSAGPSKSVASRPESAGAHSKTSTEDRRKQVLVNQTCIDDVDKHESRSLRQTVRVSDLPTQHRKDILDRNAQGDKLVADFIGGYHWAYMPALSREELYERCSLELPWDKIQDLFARFSMKPGTDPFYNETVAQLCDRRGESARLIEILQRVDPQRNFTAPYVQAVIEFHELASIEFINAPQTLALLRQSDDHVQHLREVIDAKHEERRLNLDVKEDMATAEKIHNVIDDLLEELLVLYLERMDVLEGAGQDDSFLDNLRESAEKVRDLHEKSGEHMYPIPGIPAKDIERLHKQMQNVRDEMAEDAESVGRKEQLLRQKLKENSEAQARKFDAIDQLYKEILDLSRERKETIELIVQMKKEHESRKAAAERFFADAQDHERVLRELIEALAIGPPTCRPESTTHPWTINTVKDAEEQVEQARQETSGKLLEERRAYYKVFCEYYLVCGELLFNKELRLEEIQGQISDSEWNLTMIRQTLDPNIKMYRERLKTLESLMEPCKREIAALRVRMDKAAADAQPIEDHLVAAGDEIVSPLIELQERNADRQKEILCARRKLMSTKTSRVEHQEENVAQIEDSARVAKSSGGSSMGMRPLSPEKIAPSPRTGVEKQNLMDMRRKKYAERLRRSVHAASDPILTGSRGLGGDFSPHTGSKA